MLISYVSCCPFCGEHLLGDGFIQVLNCPNADYDWIQYVEPDANPVYCKLGLPIQSATPDLIN